MSILQKEKKRLREMYDNLNAIEAEVDLYDCGRALLTEINPGLILRYDKQYSEMAKQLELCKSLELQI